MYRRALGNKPLRTAYIDAFSGTGEIPLSSNDPGFLELDSETEAVIQGSASRAIGVEPEFDRYLFIDSRRACVQALENRFRGHRLFPKMAFRPGDANAVLSEVCRSSAWQADWRGVVFLDPFGNQVTWATVETIARTGSLDLWYLFPSGGGVYRQVSKEGAVHPTHESSLDNLLGTTEWRTEFIATDATTDLLGEQSRQRRNVTPDAAADFMIKRLETVFRGGVLHRKIPLGNLSYPSFHLLFACGNPKRNAGTLALRLADAAINAVDKRYGRLV